MENKPISFIKKALPGLEIESVDVNSRGWDNDILIVNRSIVFRFPKNNAIAIFLLFHKNFSRSVLPVKGEN